MSQDQGLYHLPTRVRPGRYIWQPAVTGIVMLAAVFELSTLSIAAAFGYDPALGSPLLSLGPIHLYAPWAWIPWAIQWSSAGGAAEAAFRRGYWILFGGIAATAIGVGVWRFRLVRSLNAGTEHIHGSARFATAEEIVKAGLIGRGAGVYIGGFVDPKIGTVNYLRHDGPHHVIAIAPTRSGKGVGLVLPTLLAWPGSALVYDIKGENWALSAGWRTSIGQRCLRFEATALSGCHRFNPLAEIRLGTDYEVSDVQNIVAMIVDPDGKGMNDHWAKTGSALLVGSILHVLYEAVNDQHPTPSLGDVADFLSDPSRTIEETFNVMLEAIHDPSGSRGWDNGTHPVIAGSARDMLNKSSNEASGVLSTAMSFLTLYRDPIVRGNTSASDWCINDLVNGEAPASLYLVVPPSDKDRLKPLIRLVINQILRQLTRDMKFENGASVRSYKHRLLAMIDEFTSLGRLPIFEESLAFMAGYGIKAYLIIQDISQLNAAYTRDEAIIANCHVRVVYAPNKPETAEWISKLTGEQTVQHLSVSVSGDPSGFGKRSMSQSAQLVKRPLMTADEVARLPGPETDAQGRIVKAGDMLVFIAGMRPIYGKQILYFLDPVFSERAKIPPPGAAPPAEAGPVPEPPPPPPGRLHRALGWVLGAEIERDSAA
jgi:type IV secretion system protein VirD4